MNSASFVGPSASSVTFARTDYLTAPHLENQEIVAYNTLESPHCPFWLWKSVVGLLRMLTAAAPLALTKYSVSNEHFRDVGHAHREQKKPHTSESRRS